MSSNQSSTSVQRDGTASAQAAVLLQSAPVPDDAVKVKGPDLERALGLEELLASYERIGFQATGLAKAIRIIDRMRTWRLSNEPFPEGEEPTPELLSERASTKCTIFLGYTSNLISSGLREVLLFLVKHNLVSALVTTAGGVEEDFIKCLGHTYLGEFSLDGAGLRKKGMNRIGNLIVPNDNYCKFEDWVMPILDRMREEQDLGEDEEGEGRQRMVWTPSKIIARLGKEIDNEESVYYWAYKNNIPVFCPALTDGSLGDMLYFHSYKSPGLIIDLIQDIRRLNDMSVKAKKAGMVILGGGVCKHQIANAMLFRNGADYAVYINTGNEFDGSDSGARPDEAVSWGKIKSHNEDNVVKVRWWPIHADATLVFPLVVAATWGKARWKEQAPQKEPGPQAHGSDA